MELRRSWGALEARLQQIAEDPTNWDLDANPADRDLVGLELVNDDGSLTDLGDAYYMAKFVRGDAAATKEAIADILKRSPVANTFCGHLWASGEIPKTGAVTLIKRITQSQNLESAKRWLQMMNDGGLIVYNRSHPTIRVLYNPTELAPPEEEAQREKFRGHLISPDTPFTNVVALRELLRSARGDVRWYEPHLPGKVLEVLFSEVDGEGADSIRLLSGPANVTEDLKDDYKRFRAEMKAKRGVDVEWRILTKREAANHHDRVFFADGIARNIPPLNTILKGSTGEILESGIDPSDFESWWAEGQDLKGVQIPPTP
jgi:hypothetical protein